MSEPVEITPELVRGWSLPATDEAGDKDSRGRVLIVGGCREAPGGVMLSALAAFRAGAGKVQIATAESVAPGLALSMPECLVHGLPEGGPSGLAGRGTPRLQDLAGRCDAMLVGPGLTVSEDAGELARLCLAEAAEATAVLDAGALGRIDALRDALRPLRGRAVLTPHAGEMATLLDRPKPEIEADPLSAAREAASFLDAVVVLKGAVTHVVAPDGRAWRNHRGHHGLGVSGSGDTLAGVLAALSARGAEPAQAAVHAVLIHALCGERLAERVGAFGYLMRELPGEIPAVLSELAR